MSRGSPVYFKSIPDTKIVFNYIPRKYLTSDLHITNITDQPIAFKVKTNVPISYLVKPHLGIILPQRSVDISITMQPTDYNPQNASISDKFLVNAIPLPTNIDLSTLSDQAQFTKIWEEVPKSQLQAVKLSVALQFEDNSRNTSILDKTGELDSSKDLAKDPLLDSKRRETTPSEPRKSATVDLSNRESRNATTDLSSSTSLMVSFSDPKTELSASRLISGEKSAISRLESEPQTLMNTQGVLANKQKSEAKELKQPQVVTPTQEEKKAEIKPANKNLEEKAEQLEKREGELAQEKNNLNQKNQDLNSKNDDLRKMLLDLSEENTRLKSELLNLKSSTFKEKPAKTEGLDANVYQLWHVLVVAIIAMILGAFLSTN